MTRILAAVTNDLTYDQRMHRICRTLAKAGYDVTLIGRQLSDSVSLDNQLFTQKRLRCWFIRGPLFYAEYNLRLWAFLMRNKFDIAMACDLDTALAVRTAAAWKSRRSVMDAHELFTEVPELAGRKFASGTWLAIGRRTVPNFDLRYSVGEHIAKELGDKYGAPFEVIRSVPLMSQSTFVPFSERKKSILYQGALNEGRGLEAAIDAMAHVDAQYTLHLAGEGDLSDVLRSQVWQKGLQDRVAFLGMKKPEELRVLTQHATLGLNLLEARSRSYYLSLANKFFDYIHAGVPSINMDFPEYRAIIKQYPVGVCVDGLEAESLARHINALLEDQQKMQAMISMCLQAREEFNWDKEGEKLLKLYQAMTDL